MLTALYGAATCQCRIARNSVTEWSEQGIWPTMGRMTVRYPPSLHESRLRSRAGPLAFAVDDFAQKLATDGYANYSI